jgi:hypothetical protein
MYDTSLFADPELEDEMISLLLPEVLMMAEDKAINISTGMHTCGQQSKGIFHRAPSLCLLAQCQ